MLEAVRPVILMIINPLLLFFGCKVSSLETMLFRISLQWISDSASPWFWQSVAASVVEMVRCDRLSPRDWCYVRAQGLASAARLLWTSHSQWLTSYWSKKSVFLICHHDQDNLKKKSFHLRLKLQRVRVCDHHNREHGRRRAGWCWSSSWEN